MLLHVLSRHRSESTGVPRRAVRLLASTMQGDEVEVLADVVAVDAATDDDPRVVDETTRHLRTQWLHRRPDLVLAVGTTAVRAALDARDSVVPVVAVLDEAADGLVAALSERACEHAAAVLDLARRADAVLPLSCSQADRWRSHGVRVAARTLLPWPVPVVEAEASAKALDGGRRAGVVVTSATGPTLDWVIEALPSWPDAPLAVLTRLDGRSLQRLTARARALGVADRLQWRHGLDATARRALWRDAAVVVAGSDSAAHGGHVIEAAAHGVPAVATAEGAHRDMVIPGATGVLVHPGAGPRTLGAAVAGLLGDTLYRQGLGEGARLRAQTLHDPEVARPRMLRAFQDVRAEWAQRTAEPLVLVSDQDVLAPLGVEERRLIDEHLSLARQLAQRYTGRGQPLDDLVQVACLGLVKAARRFDATLGKPFVAYAIPTILGELRRHFRDHAWAVRVPRSMQENTMLVERSTELLSHQLGHDATTTELADHLGLTTDEVLQARQTKGEAMATRSLDVPTGLNGVGAVSDHLGVDDVSLERVEERAAVRNALRQLPDREREILVRRYYAEQTQHEIATTLGMSQVHVSRIISRTLGALREHVEDEVPLPDRWGAGAPAGR